MLRCAGRHCSLARGRVGVRVRVRVRVRVGALLQMHCLRTEAFFLPNHGRCDTQQCVVLHLLWQMQATGNVAEKPLQKYTNVDDSGIWPKPDIVLQLVMRSSGLLVHPAHAACEMNIDDHMVLTQQSPEVGSKIGPKILAWLGPPTIVAMKAPSRWQS